MTKEDEAIQDKIEAARPGTKEEAMTEKDPPAEIRINKDGLDAAARVAGPGSGVDPVDPLESMAYAAERASDQDRAWFEMHPDATEYYRKPVEGEFGRGYYGPEARVRVRLVGPGLRTRQPLGDIAVTDPETVRMLGGVPTLSPEWAEALGFRKTEND